MAVLQTVTDEIRERIVNGSLPSDRPFPSCKSFGMMFGVSPATVNSAIKKLEEEGLVHRKLGNKIYPAGNIDTGAGNKIDTIGVIGTDAFGKNDIYYQSYIDAFKAEATKRALDFKFFQLKGLNLSSRTNSNILEHLFNPNMGIVVIAPIRPHDIGLLSRSQIPFVVIDEYYSTDSPCVVVDDSKKAKLFADHMEEQGCKSCGLIAVSDQLQGAEPQPLYRLLKKELTQRGIEFSSKSHLATGKVNKSTSKKIITFFKEDRTEDAFLIIGEELNIKVHEALGERYNNFEFIINASQEILGINNCQIVNPTKEQIALAVKYLLNESEPERKVISLAPKIKLSTTKN